MARGQYYVSKDAERWKVQHTDIQITFASPRAALSAALNAANQAGQRGFGGRVLVQRPDGQWRTEWIYGRDPLPEMPASA